MNSGKPHRGFKSPASLFLLFKAVFYMLFSSPVFQCMENARYCKMCGQIPCICNLPAATAAVPYVEK